MDFFLAPVHRPIRRRCRLLFAGTLAAACLASAGVRAQDDPPGRVGRVAEVAGAVRTVNPEGAWDALVRNQPLSTGDRISTERTGRATLQFGSTTVRVGADSDLIVTQLDDQKIRLHFDHGQLAVRVRSDDIPGELFIETDEGAWVPHHRGQYRFDRAAHQVLAAQVWSGDMLLEAPDSSLPLAAPRRAEVWRSGARQTTHYRLVAALEDAFGDAVLAADKADDKLAAASAAAPVPAEMTGAAELARYGAWSVAAGGLHLWTPGKLPAGWAPYQQGAWSWNSPWGWTWIDDQPWGFAPFHYGRWLSLKGHWAWTPGQWGAVRPVYAPALVGWFGGPALTLDGAPAVGWVALAPDEPVFPAYAVSARYWNALTDASVAPASRRPVAIAGRARLVPAGAAAYANRAVPGAATVVGVAALLPHVPVPTMPGARGAQQRKPAFEAALDRATVQGPPPAPPGHAALAPAAPVLTLPAATQVPAKVGSAPIRPTKTTARVSNADFTKPVPPVPVAPLVTTRPVAPTLATAPVKPITAPLPPAPIVSR